MKTFLMLLLYLTFGTILSAQEIELPFFDDFSNDYENWTPYSVNGDDQWHLSGDDGIDGGKCARFYITTDPPMANDDWLVSKAFNTEGLSNIAIEFKFKFYGTGQIPEFFYTNNFTGNISTTQWTAVNNSFWKNEGYWNDARIEIENPGNTLVFAFQYLSTEEIGNYILIDNFYIESYVPTVYEKVGSTEHFEFFTEYAEKMDYWTTIKDTLESNYKKYCGYWNIPGLDNFLDENKKIKIYFTDKENITFVSETTSKTKSGFYDRDAYIIYLSPLDNQEKVNFYGSLEGLAINTFANFAIQHRELRDYGQEYYLPDYFSEGFGLYEQGYRPNRDSIIDYRRENSAELTHDFLESMNIFTNTKEKDILVSYVEGLVICYLGYKCTAPYSSYIPIWNNFLIYFYDTTDVVQIKKYDESKNFDIYCSSRDTMFIDSMQVWLERTRQYYVDSFEMDINVRYPLVIMYDEKTGMDLTGYGDFNGGGGTANISPHNFWGGFDDGYDWLLGHEFGHVFNDLMYYNMPFGFYHEGMANFSGYNVAGGEHLDDLWKIGYVFDYYQNKHKRKPTLNEIITNRDAGEPGLEWGIDCYFFGFEFIRYLKNNEGYTNIKGFFENGLDWDVFDNSYDDIEDGYIEYLEFLYAHIDSNIPQLITNKAIYIEQGSSVIINSDNLSATDQEVTDDKLYYKIRTKPTNGYIENVNNPGVAISKFTEQDIKSNLIKYVNNNSTAKMDYFIFTLTDETFFIDNKKFNIILTTPTLTSDYGKTPENKLGIFPNPVTSESTISFQTKTSENVNLSIFDIQGRKICTLLNEKMNTGMHTIPLSNRLPASGVYFCNLTTSKGVSTKKIIVN